MPLRNLDSILFASPWDRSVVVVQCGLVVRYMSDLWHIAILDE